MRETLPTRGHLTRVGSTSLSWLGSRASIGSLLAARIAPSGLGTAVAGSLILLWERSMPLNYRLQMTSIDPTLVHRLPFLEKVPIPRTHVRVNRLRHLFETALFLVGPSPGKVVRARKYRMICGPAKQR